jgi:hypothetical protein
VASCAGLNATSQDAPGRKAARSPPTNGGRARTGSGAARTATCVLQTLYRRM